MKKIVLFFALSAIQTVVFSQVLDNLKEISSFSDGSSYPDFIKGNDKMFFVTRDTSFDTYNQGTLWVTRGTEATTTALINVSNPFASGNGMAFYNDRLFFQRWDSLHGVELWVTDGTVAGTTLFKDLAPGTADSYPAEFAIANNKLFFTIADENNYRRIFVSDGTATGTLILRTFMHTITPPVVCNNEVYFGGVAAVSSLWKSDGTPGGTTVVKFGINPDFRNESYAALDNRFYFRAHYNVDVSGDEIWVSNGSDTGTYMLKSLRADTGQFKGSFPSYFTVSGNKVFFNASDDEHGYELFVTDGTGPGTKIVKDLLPGVAGGAPNKKMDYNGKAYLSFDVPLLRQTIWMSDGTDSGTVKVLDSLVFAGLIAVWNHTLYFVAKPDLRLWQTDGTAEGTSNAVIENSANPVYLGNLNVVEFNSALYLSARCDGITGGYEPCKLNYHTYIFTGDGNWDIDSNWDKRIVPPQPLMQGDTVIINGNCILNIQQHAQSGSSVIVNPGRNLLIPGELKLD